MQWHAPSSQVRNLGWGHDLPLAPVKPVSDRASESRLQAGEPVEAFRIRSVVRTVPQAVWAVSALFASLLLAYVVLLPIYRAPDEVDHVDAVYELEQGEGWAEPGTDLLDPPVITSLHLSGLLTLQHYPAAAAPPQRAKRSFDTLPGTIDPSQTNQITQHPPLFYALDAVPLKVVGGTSWAYDKTVLFLRLLSALMVLPLPVLAHAAARRVRGPGALAVTASILPLAVPQLVHIGASVNNDNLLTLLFGLLTVALMYVVTGDLSRGTAVRIGVLSALALLTKGFAFIVPVWIGLTYILALCRYRRRTALTSALVALAVTTLLGGWWWLRNLLKYGAVQPAGEKPITPPPGFVPNLHLLLNQYGYLPKSFWGAFGYFNVVLPDTEIKAATWVLAVGVVLALVAPGRFAIDRALVLAAPFLGLLILLMLLSRRTYLSTGQFRGLQGRYMFPGIVGASVLVAGGLVGPLRRAGRWVPLLAVALAGVMQAYAARAILNGFWRPIDGNASYADALHTLFVWSAWPKPIAAAALAAPLLFGLLAAGALARTRSRLAPGPCKLPGARHLGPGGC